MDQLITELKRESAVFSNLPLVKTHSSSKQINCESEVILKYSKLNFIVYGRKCCVADIPQEPRGSLEQRAIRLRTLLSTFHIHRPGGTPWHTYKKNAFELRK